MKLEVLTGYREYLLPHAVDRAGLTAALRDAIPRATIPLVRWVDGDPVWYHGFVFDDDAEAERRAALLLEYVQDATATDDTAVVILPFERWSDPSSRGATLAHPRVRMFVDLAVATLGPARVKTRRIALSDNTQAVLDRLHQAAGHPAAGPRSAVIPTTLVEGPVFGTSLEAMRLNYGASVLALCEEILQRQGVLGPRADDAPPRDPLQVRTELPADRILAELEPGGALRGLLTR